MPRFIFLIFFLVVLLYYSRVVNDLTASDKIYIDRYLLNIDIDNYIIDGAEIELIKAVQDSVLSVSPNMNAIPMNFPREPENAFISGMGVCATRSRVIEKILRYIGFRTRHVAIYSISMNPPLLALLTPGNASHAILEVKTKKGWIAVGSNYRWVAEDQEGNYLSVKKIKYQIDNSFGPTWKNRPQENILNNQFVYIYGLYSRHGGFYPPYNFIPDIEWNEFAYNFFD